MRRLFTLLVALPILLCLYSGIAAAALIEPTRAALIATDEGYALSANFTIDLGPRVEEAVTHGVPLYFNLELEVTRPRAYCQDEHVLSHTLTYRLSYNALTRQYRLATGSLHRSFDSVAHAVRAMGRISALPIADKSRFKAGYSYQAALRLGLDRGLLPKPFQLDAIISRDWQIEARVLQWLSKPAGEAE